MKHLITRFTTLAVALKELEPYIKNGEHLQTGKPFKQFGGLRSREILANWLLCVSANFSCGSSRLTFITDPSGGDGIIVDQDTGQTWPTEHVLVPRSRTKDVDVNELILRSIRSRKGNPNVAAFRRHQDLESLQEKTKQRAAQPRHAR